MNIQCQYGSSDFILFNIYSGQEVNWGSTIVHVEHWEKKVEMHKLFLNYFFAGPELVWDNTEPRNIKVVLDSNKSNISRGTMDPEIVSVTYQIRD